MTIRQQKAINNIIVNGGKVAKGMRDAGYSEAMVRNSHKLTRSKAFKSAIEPLLKQNNVTLDQYIMNIGNAMQADKTVIIGKGDDAFADNVPDHAVRLQGNKQAERFLFKGDTTDPASKIDNQAILDAVKRGDTVTLSQAVFNPVEPDKS